VLHGAAWYSAIELLADWPLLFRVIAFVILTHVGLLFTVDHEV
jgi:hypothetical protein